MDDEHYEKRLLKTEQRLRECENRIKDLNRREKRLHNLVLRLSAINMAVTESLQKHGQIKPKKFKEQVERFIANLDQEISEKKTGNLLEKIWRELEEID
jgi:hypothetical protein